MEEQSNLTQGFIPLEHVIDLMRPGVKVFQHETSTNGDEEVESMQEVGVCTGISNTSCLEGATGFNCYLSCRVKDTVIWFHDNKQDYYVFANQFADALAQINGTALDFSTALVLAKRGYAICREGWNGKGMFVAMMPSMYLDAYNDQTAKFKVNDRTSQWVGKDTPLTIPSYFAMYTADGKWQPGWLASQQDLFANDWSVYQR